MPRHPALNRIRKPPRKTDNLDTDVGVSRETVARVIAPLQEEEEETVEINDDDNERSEPLQNDDGATPGAMPAARPVHPARGER